MTATMMATKQITVSDRAADGARSVSVPRDASLVMRNGAGEEVELPAEIQQVLFGTLQAIARGGQVTIGRTPETLTSTVAADMLGISRPTLMKLVKEGRIDSFKVGSHTRFKRDAVLRVREERAKSRRAAFDELRQMDADTAHLFDD